MGIKVMSFHCTLRNRLGHVISQTTNQDVLAQPSRPGERLGALADGLQELHTGERREICINAEQAYGFYDLKKVISRAKDEISGADGIRVGDLVKLKASNGKLEALRVIEDQGDQFVFDGNHPLAGQDLIFDIEVFAARDVTAADLSEEKAEQKSAEFH